MEGKFWTGIPVCNEHEDACCRLSHRRTEILGSNELLADYAEDLADIILQLMNDRQRQIEIGQRYHLRVNERFSVEVTICMCID